MLSDYGGGWERRHRKNVRAGTTFSSGGFKTTSPGGSTFSFGVDSEQGKRQIAMLRARGQLKTALEAPLTKEDKVLVAKDKLKKAEDKYRKFLDDRKTRHETKSASTKAARFKSINDALTASREADAKHKDKLGNTMGDSPQTLYLQQQLQAILAEDMKRAGQTGSARKAGVTFGQEEQIRRFGPDVIPRTGADFDKTQEDVPLNVAANRAAAQQVVPPGDPREPGNLEPGSPYAGMPGTSDLLQRGPVRGEPKTLEYIPPKRGDRGEAMINGQRQQVVVEEVFDTPQGQALKIRLRDGSFVAIPIQEFGRIDLSDPLPGDAPPDPGGQRRGFFEHEGRRAGIQDVLTGL
jgi:hypothetical protein